MNNYQFIIKNPFGEVFFKSIRRFESVSLAQIAGLKFLTLSRTMDNRAELSAKENYVDVVNT